MRPFASTARVAPEMTPKLKASKLRIVTSSGSEEDMPTEAQESTESVSANEVSHRGVQFVGSSVLWVPLSALFCK